MPQMPLDDENETLDWGNEEEEYQESFRRLHAGQDRTLPGDDVEDTISLGDDEDDQRFYSLSRHDAINSAASYKADQPESPPSSQSKSTASGANPPQLGHRSPEPQTQGAQVLVLEAPVNQETPQKKSAARHSPHRSLPRLTHALPPKPVAASVTALTQAYPAVIAVTTITPISPRSAARDSKIMNGKLGLSPASADLPQEWETRCSRKGETYYYNRVTHECTWSLPGGKAPVVPSSAQEDSKSRRQRRSVSPGGNKEIVSFDSNTSRLQTSRSNKDFPRAGEPDFEEKRRALTPDPDGLTFEDRHYRPGLNSVSVPDGIRGFDRSDISISAGRHARSPSPRRRKPASSPDSELHFRTKELPRDQRSVQEKSAPTKAIPSVPKLDSYRPDYDGRRRPPSSPRSPADYHGRSQREHASYGEEDRMQVDFVPGPSLRREDISRDHRQRSKDRDLPPVRNLDVRDPSASQNYFSAQRSRSPVPLPQPRERERDIRNEKQEARDHGYHYEDGARHSEWEIPRQYEGSHGTKIVQDYARGRERPVDPDMDPPRGRNSERERVRERDRPDRDRDVHNTRREINTGIVADQRPQGDIKSKGNPEDYDRKPEDPTSARSKRTPLPPQQASFRSARVRDPPPHPISTPSKRPEDKRAIVGVADDNVPRQPRNPLSSVHSPLLESSRPPNGLDLQRFQSGHESHERPSYIRDSASYSDKRMNVIRDAPPLGKHQSGPSDRRLPEDLQRSSNVTSDERGSPRPRTSIAVNGRRDSNYDKLKEGDDRDVQPPLERINSRRGRDVPRQPARLTGTNNVPIGNRRFGVAGPASLLDQEVGPLSTITVRNLPPGKESYERPPDTAPSDSSRQSGPSSRTESKRSLHELRQPQARHDESRGRKLIPHPLALTQQYSNGSSNRPSSPPLSRDLSGSMPSVPGRLSTYPSSDGRSDFSFRAGQNADPPGKSQSRGSYRQRDDSITRRDPHRVLRQLSYSPIHPPPDGADGAQHHSSAGCDPLPPRVRKVGGAGPDQDARFIDSKISAKDRSDFISRVEPPPLRRGGSLLDRLSIDNKDRELPTDSLPILGTSLRDRLVPSKRDRDEMMHCEATSSRGLGEKLQDPEGSESKRARKRGGGKRRSGGRRI